MFLQERLLKEEAIETKTETVCVNNTTTKTFVSQEIVKGQECVNEVQLASPSFVKKKATENSTTPKIGKVVELKDAKLESKGLVKKSNGEVSQQKSTNPFVKSLNNQEKEKSSSVFDSLKKFKKNEK